MIDLSMGTVTFLFTDIEGSTNLARILGSRWFWVLGEYYDILCWVIWEHGGVDVRTEGDVFFVVFTFAVDVVVVVVQAQWVLAQHAWFDDGFIRVRMGMHIGEGCLV